MSEGSMSVCDCVEMVCFSCEVGFDDEAILIDFIGVGGLYSLACAIGVFLL